MKKWKKAMALLLGFCMLAGPLTMAPVMEAKADSGERTIYFNADQTGERLEFFYDTENITIYVQDDKGDYLPFTTYYFKLDGTEKAKFESVPINGNPGHTTQAAYMDSYNYAWCTPPDGKASHTPRVDIYPAEQENPSGQETPPEQENPSGQETPPAQGTSSDDGGHHSYIWVTETEATATVDAIEGYECTHCGRISQYRAKPNSAYAKFNQDAATSIRKAQNNETVTLDTNLWNSFHKDVFDALAERPDVSLTVKYRYEGKRYTVTIPSGSDVTSLPDANGYCGFRYLDATFGGSELTVG